jgi:LysM repeat protein
MKYGLRMMGFGALAVLGAAACGSGGGTGAAPASTLKIGTPSYQTLLPQVTSTLPSPTVPGQPGAVVPGSQTYTVKSGDIMVRIAKAYCITAQAIVDYNGWEDGFNHFLTPGATINIPPGACAPGSATPEVTAPNVAIATSTTFDASLGGFYTVQSGDYLSGIASKTGSTVQGIIDANGWVEGTGHVLIPGEKIRLPPKTG